MERYPKYIIQWKKKHVTQRIWCTIICIKWRKTGIGYLWKNTEAGHGQFWADKPEFWGRKIFTEHLFNFQSCKISVYLKQIKMFEELDNW